jgi:ribonuclease J
VDQSPVNGAPPDLARLARLGDAGVLLLLSDSTNADVEGMTPSERSVAPALASLISGAAGRVLVATFASNISRLQQVVQAAENADRHCLFIGRSMLNNIKVAQELGFLEVGRGTVVSPKQANRLPDAEMCILCTGSQGEPLSALSRIAGGEHPLVSLHPGDTVVLSANPIPGNEEAVHLTVNNLDRLGAHTYRGSARGLHASGHAAREELRLMLTLCRPRYFMPVHGEYRHLAAHRELAIASGVLPENVAAVDNGKVVEIDGEGLHVLDRRVPAGYVYVDGLSLEDATDVVFRDRRQLAEDGLIIVHLAVERSTGAIVAGPELIARGFIEDADSAALFDEAQIRVREILEHLAPDAGWAVWKGAVHETLSRFLFKRTNRRPLILPLVTEV